MSDETVRGVIPLPEAPAAKLVVPVTLNAAVVGSPSLLVPAAFNSAPLDTVTDVLPISPVIANVPADTIVGPV